MPRWVPYPLLGAERPTTVSHSLGGKTFDLTVAQGGGFASAGLTEGSSSALVSGARRADSM